MFEDAIMTLVNWALNIGYPGLFTICFLSNLIIFIPIPYLLFVFILSSYTSIDLTLLSIVSALGATVAKLVIFSLSKYERRFMGKKSLENVDFARNVLGTYGFLAVFVVAALPVTDDALFIPMGLMNYSTIKFFFACLPGKLLLSLIASFGGRFSFPWVRVLIIPDNPVGIVFGIAVTIGTIYITFKTDWRKMVCKYIPLKVCTEPEK